MGHYPLLAIARQSQSDQATALYFSKYLHIMPLFSSDYFVCGKNAGARAAMIREVTNFRQILLVFRDELRNILVNGPDLLFICTNVQ